MTLRMAAEHELHNDISWPGCIEMPRIASVSDFNVQKVVAKVVADDEVAAVPVVEVSARRRGFAVTRGSKAIGRSSEKNYSDCDSDDHSLESVDLTSSYPDSDNSGCSKQEEDQASIDKSYTEDQSLQHTIQSSYNLIPLAHQSNECSSEANCGDQNKNTKDSKKVASNSDVFPSQEPTTSMLIKVSPACEGNSLEKISLLSVENDAQCINICQTDFLRPRRNELDVCGGRRTSVFDDLLFDIYDRWHSGWRDSFDSDTFTDLTESDAFLGRNEWNPSETDTGKKHLNTTMLKNKDVFELEQMISDICHRINQMSSHLVRHLKCRERRLTALRNKCDIVTAILHASSLKRRIDSKIRFSIEPLPGDDAFNQWKDAMKAVARLPMGIPPEFRKKVWMSLADNYLNGLCVDWEKTKRLAFNEKSNPDDSKLGLQIVKDLHRTGCSGFNGRDNEEDRAVLKRVLLAYARWNKLVGYCQGFNILAALILDVVDRKEDCALKVMIFLVDRVLPESYFANNLRALSVDMAVFRDLLRSNLPQLSKHLGQLQSAACDLTTGANYEPPLTNVFTMQWFLTLFATCLPKSMALRVWDSVFLEGSEILLRTAIAIWGTLESRILSIQSADEFYTSMGILSQEMLDGKIVDADKLIKAIYTMAPFPFPQLMELREKYTYNITPFTAALNSGKNPQPTMARSGSSAMFAEDEDFDEDEMMDNINCFAGLFLPQYPSPLKTTNSADVDSSSDISKASPGAYAATPVDIAVSMPAYSDRVTLDIDLLHKQYKRLKQRQKQAHIILTAASARQKQSQALTTNCQDLRVPPLDSPTAVNHLFVSRQMMNSRKQNIAGLPTVVTASFCSGGGNHGDSNLAAVQLLNSVRTGQMPTGDISSDDLRCRHSHSPSIDSSVSYLSDVSQRSDSLASDSTYTGGSEKSFGMCNATSCSSLNIQSDKENGSQVASSEESLEHAVHADCRTVEKLEDEEKNEEEGSLQMELTEILTEKQGTRSTVQPIIEICQGDIACSHRKDEAFSSVGNICLSHIVELDSNAENDNFLVQQPGLEVKLDQDRRTEIDSLGARYKSTSNQLYQQKLSFTKPPSSQELKQEKLSLKGLPESHSSLEAVVKVFNPFPKQYLNPRKTRNNIRLGLYSDDNLTITAVGGGQVKRSADQLRRTAYLQRQYMMDMSKQSKTKKS